MRTGSPSEMDPPLLRDNPLPYGLFPFHEKVLYGEGKSIEKSQNLS